MLDSYYFRMSYVQMYVGKGLILWLAFLENIRACYPVGISGPSESTSDSMYGRIKIKIKRPPGPVCK